MSDPRIIKRYANRKLYDSRDSRYVTLEEVAALVRGGIEVQVLDNKTKEDITGRILAQCVAREEGERHASIPIHALRNLVQSGGEILTRTVSQPVNTLVDEAERTVQTLRNEAEKKVSNLRGEAERTVTHLREDVERGYQKLKWKDRDSGEPVRKLLKEWKDQTQSRIDEAHKALDERFTELLAALPTVHSNEAKLERLQKRVDALEAELAEIRAKTRTDPSAEHH